MKILRGIARAINAAFVALYQLFSGQPAQKPTPRIDRRVVLLKRFHEVTTDPPPMYWAPCHPRAIKHFKASMTCPRGHGLTLRNHSVSGSGQVHPSVVCPTVGCDFHEFVRLDGWSFGNVQTRP
jgi:hypothetical protein